MHWLIIRIFIMSRLGEILAFFMYGDIPTRYFIKRGMTVGKNFNRQSGTRLDPSHCWLISIGDDVTLSNKVQILAHDDTTRIYTGYGRIGRVLIGNRVFVGASTTILMNTKIGDDVIIGAGSVVTKDIPDDSVVVGNPARVIGKTSEFIDREMGRMKQGVRFDKSYSYYHSVGLEKKKEMQEFFSKNPQIGYLELGKYSD